MAKRFTDERGTIQDIFGPVDAVTEIRTVKGAIRGNHRHEQTIQWTYICSGLLLVVTEHGGVRHEETLRPGQITCERPGVAHAWKALEDTTVLVFTRGPRSGENYESDVQRLEVPLLCAPG
jgi:quercetin dioxygenase-like cupin family protein